MCLESKSLGTYGQKFINFLPFSLLNKDTKTPLLKNVCSLAEFYNQERFWEPSRINFLESRTYLLHDNGGGIGPLSSGEQATQPLKGSLLVFLAGLGQTVCRQMAVIN